MRYAGSTHHSRSLHSWIMIPCTLSHHSSQKLNWISDSSRVSERQSVIACINFLFFSSCVLMLFLPSPIVLVMPNIVFVNCRPIHIIIKLWNYYNPFYNWTNMSWKPTVLLNLIQSVAVNRARNCLTRNSLCTHVRSFINLIIIDLCPQQPTMLIWFIIERTCVCSVHAQNNYTLR